MNIRTKVKGFHAILNIQNRIQFLVTRSDIGMETMSDPAGTWDAATKPLPEWGRRDSVNGAAGRHPPFEDIHLRREREGISRSEHI